MVAWRIALILNRALRRGKTNLAKVLRGEMIRDLVERVLFFRDGDKTFFEPEAFPWVAALRAEWKAIRRELDALMVRRERDSEFPGCVEGTESS